MGSEELELKMIKVFTDQLEKFRLSVQDQADKSRRKLWSIVYTSIAVFGTLFLVYIYSAGKVVQKVDGLTVAVEKNYRQNAALADKQDQIVKEVNDLTLSVKVMKAIKNKEISIE